MEQLQMKKDSAGSAAEEIGLSIRKQVLFMQFYLLDCLLLDHLVAQKKIQEIVSHVIQCCLSNPLWLLARE